MQIFAVDDNPIKAAKFQCDKHVVKMILETYELLAIALNLSYSNWRFHPAAKWAKESINNQAWLYEHGTALCKEYTKRYGKEHSFEAKFINLKHQIDGNWENHTEFKQIIPEEFKKADPVDGYRNYYKNGRVKTFAKWKLEQPEWYKDRNEP